VAAIAPKAHPGLDRADGRPAPLPLPELATEFEISPDGKWLAFREGFNAYVTPFVETGRRVDIGPKSKAVPVTRVSKEAGEYLRFSGDSSRLYWAVGPQLFQRDLKEAFAFLPELGEAARQFRRESLRPSMSPQARSPSPEAAS
jgi:hypothetical protein